MADSTRTAKVAVLEDDRLAAHNLKVNLDFIGERSVIFSSGNWRSLFEQQPGTDEIFAAIIGNLKDLSPEAVLKEFISHGVRIPVLLLGQDQSISTELQTGEWRELIEVVERPLHYQALVKALQRARGLKGLAQRDQAFSSTIVSPSGEAMFRSLVGESRKMQQVRELIKQAADKDVTVLIRGESGTGKEIVARNLHYHSGRGEKPFEAINCAAVSPETLAKELFGEEANGQEIRPGRLGKAAGGTLFLDVVDEMPATIQAMLLGFLEHRQFRRMGGNEPVTSDARIIAATQRDLEELSRTGHFRQDLYYRLNVFPIEMPSLRERAEDLPDLLNELAARLERKSGVSVRFNSAALLSLQRHLWPGNVRELTNLVERLSIIRPNEILGVSDLPAGYQHVDDAEIASLERPETAEQRPAGGESEASPADQGRSRKVVDAPQGPLNAENLKEYLLNLERDLIEVALDDCNGLTALAAERLGMKETTLKEKLNRAKPTDV